MSDDFFLFDTERLKQLASEETIKKGLDYFNQNRVFDLDGGEDQIYAWVEGSITDEPY